MLCLYPGGLTYSGHPLAAAAAVATINAMENEQIVKHAAALGETVIGPALRGFAERHPSVGEVRGKSVFWAIELVKDRQTREPLAPYGGSSPEMNQLVAACKSPRPAPVRELQAHPRRPAVQHRRGRHPEGPGHPGHRVRHRGRFRRLMNWDIRDGQGPHVKAPKGDIGVAFGD